jgi:hypothetical protein
MDPGDLQFQISSGRYTEDVDYEGIRIKFAAYLENARISIQIDLWFGDVVTPAPVDAELPSMPDVPKAKLLTYPQDSVVAEKIEAMVSLGLANSRMKDFYDVRRLSRDFSFEAHLFPGGSGRPSGDAQRQCQQTHRWYSPKSSSMTATRSGNGRHSVIRIGISFLRSL